VQISRKARGVATVKENRPRASAPKRAPFLSRAQCFAARLLRKYESTRHRPNDVAGVFLQSRRLIALRRFHASLRINILPRFLWNGSITVMAGPKSGPSYERRSPQFFGRREDVLVSPSLASVVEYASGRAMEPVNPARMASSNRSAVAVHPVPRVFLRPSLPQSETGVLTEVKKEERRSGEKQIPQVRFAAPDFAPEQITRLTDQVLQTIDRRIVAQRERWGRL